MLSALIPTIRTSLAPTLTSLMDQNISELIILDEGDKSVFSDTTNRYLCDMLTLRGINVRHIRRLRKGIGRARYDLIQEAKNDICLFIDDDNVLAPKTVDKLILELKRHLFVTPAVVQVNNEMGWKQYDYPKAYWEAEDLLEGLWQSQWRNTKVRHIKLVKQTSTNCVLFNKNNDFSKLKDHNQLGEDQIFCSCFKEGGVIRTDAISYHLMQPDETRKWQSQAEDIYRKSLQ